LISGKLVLGVCPNLKVDGVALFLGNSEFVTCSAISYNNDNQHMLPRKWYQGQRLFKTLTLDI
jgi:translation elongation factor EF-1alpha